MEKRKAKNRQTRKSNGKGKNGSLEMKDKRNINRSRKG